MAGKKKDITQHARFNIGRLISIYKRAFDEWATAGLAERGYPQFKISYFAVLMNINENGKTNKEIAAAAKVSKQAMSRFVKELVEMKLIQVTTHPEDNRSALLKLTAKGRDMVNETKDVMLQLESHYEKAIGKKAFLNYKETTARLINLHWPEFNPYH